MFDMRRCKRRAYFRSVVHPFQLHALLKREIRCGKERVNEMSILGQKTFDDVDVHFMTVPTDCVVAVDIPVSVYEIIHIPVILFPSRYHIVEIDCFCFRKQGEKFFRHIRFHSKVL